MLCSIGLGNSYFPTRISELEVGLLAEFRVSHLERRLPTSVERYMSFQAQWNAALVTLQHIISFYVLEDVLKWILLSLFQLLLVKYVIVSQLLALHMHVTIDLW